MRSMCTALFLALQLAGCAGRPQSPADPGPPILIEEEMDLEQTAREEPAEAAPQALVEALKTTLIDRTSAKLMLPNHLVNNYLWQLYVPRPERGLIVQAYNPDFTGDRDQAYRGDTASVDLARKVAKLPRTPESLRLNFDAHKQWLYAALSAERYRELALDLYVDELLRVEKHVFQAKNAKSVLRDIRGRLARAKSPEGNEAYPGRSNTHRAIYFGDLYDKGAEQRIISKLCPKTKFTCRATAVDLALWLHTFWYRRDLEDNRAETSKILKEIQAHYK